ncbi:MAG: hypothetical protein J7K90_01765 [Desulfuromusa sp.]|nr:hypothetical protein [Desulfuromusa sp.]
MPTQNIKQNQIINIKQSQILNWINACHYQHTPLQITLEHIDHKFDIVIYAQPMPTVSGEVSAKWIKERSFPKQLSSYQLKKIILSFGEKNYKIDPVGYHLEDEQIVFTLDNVLDVLTHRQVCRFSCQQEIVPTLTQNSLNFPCELVSFSVNSILVLLKETQGANSLWLNLNEAATISIVQGGRTIYSGTVSVKKKSETEYLLRLNHQPCARFQPRQYRTRRQKITPPPQMIFTHPITGKQNTVTVCDLGSVGLSIDEDSATQGLIPGLILPDVQIYHAAKLLMTCLLQVVYVQPFDDALKSRVGLTILDVAATEHLQMVNLVQQTRDPYVSINEQLDPGSVLKFFFESGFIYPFKYAKMVKEKDKYEKTYDIIYRQRVELERHVAYRVNGSICGHVSTIRIYRRSWMNHHLAALREIRLAGLRAVKAICEYQNDCYPLSSNKIKYVVSYYQPNNRFPKLVFGGYTDEINNLSKSSIDTFTYYSDFEVFRGCRDIPEGWSLQPADPDDVQEFNGFYQHRFGGLLPDALDLTPEHYKSDEITALYKKNGLSRNRYIWALKNQGVLKVLIDVQNSDLGLNLSEITNATTCYFLTEKKFPLNVLQSALFSLSQEYHKWSHPVMLFPSNQELLPDIHLNRQYSLWILNLTEGGESYMKWLYRFTDEPKKTSI